MTDKAEKVQVRLLAGRTGIGKRGDVVEYSREDAERYVSLGVAAYLGCDPSEPAKAADAEQLAEADEPVADDSGSGGAADESPDDENEDAEPYKKRPLKQRRRR